MGVVLSGTASDGSIGVRDIKAAGGLTIAQSPESAKYDGMPRAAVGTGMIDLILPPGQIGPRLAQFASRAVVAAANAVPATRESTLTDEHLHELFGLLHSESGIDFRHYKPPTINRRLFRRMGLHRVNEIDDYIRMLPVAECTPAGEAGCRPDRMTDPASTRDRTRSLG